MANLLQNAFRANLRSLLDETGTTQSDLARKLGVSRSYISNLLSGRYSPGLEVIERIATALEVDPHVMLEPEKIPQ